MVYVFPHKSCFCFNSHLIIVIVQLGASHVVLVVKNMSANAGDIRNVDSIPGLGRYPEGGHGNHSSIVAWKIPRTEEPGGL